MFDQIVKCGDNLMKDVEKMSHSREATDATLFVFNFSTEVIGSTAFGLDLTKNNPQAVEFHKQVGKRFKISFFLAIKYILMMAAPKFVSIFKLKILPHETNEYFINLAKAIKEYRMQKNEKRNDYFQLLLTLQQAEESGTSTIPTDNSDEDALINQLEDVPQSWQATTKSKLFTDEGLAAQSLVFLTAGTESVSSVLRFTLYYVAKSPQVQERLKEEMKAVLASHGDWTFEAIRDMTYLDNVIQETQRLHPGSALLIRECTTPYHLPNSNTAIEKGTLISIPVSSIQRDPKYYPTPEVFDPDRFVNNNHKPNPTFMPFGDGPRICIGMRFAILEVKVCLAKIFAHYSIELNSKTKESFTFEGKSCFQKPVGNIWISFKKDFQKVP